MTTETPHIADTSPHDWKYISEGGSTIVFSYSGPSHPHFDGTALRLRKGPVPAHEEPEKYAQPPLAHTLDGGEDVAEDELEEPDDPTIVFQHTVIERLVPKKHLPRLDAVHVERRWLQELAELTEPHRPLERRARDRIDTSKRKAVLATDLVGGQGWAVEIKPKWGFLPSPKHLSPETREIKTRTCRFCMHSHLKSTQGEDVSLGYCPLDLFSGDPERVTRALHTLWDVWIGSGGTVNNLRVFVKGKMLKPTADVRNPPPPVHTLTELRDAFTAAILPLLLHTPVLRTLATLQRTLDALDVEGLAALWAALRPDDAHKLGTGEADPDMDAWTRFVDEYLARQAGAGESADALPTEDELRYRLAAYLLSASFKDCSVILRMPPRSEGAEHTGTVTVIDLDVKSIDRLSKWAKLDNEIVNAYRGIVPRDCVDAKGAS
ncbi:inositol-pentakisphosphate 2-kinase [Lentinus brumalis]|uniref:Inositol-pentakisphosphate 2-kinase n=1 Tax=Lentinus brumalis TaxID=2498619 RepID=A0A371DV94_9APHY|nr:inositol-pentakisphosphate 2-kinase [Polyporus brumalis]